VREKRPPSDKEEGGPRSSNEWRLRERYCLKILARAPHARKKSERNGYSFPNRRVPNQVRVSQGLQEEEGPCRYSSPGKTKRH